MTSLLLYLCGSLVVLVAFFQLLYLLLSFRLAPPGRADGKGTGHQAPLPELAVVIPLHDCAHTIRDCLDALLAADTTPVARIIVVNDRSGDGCDVIARSYETVFRSKGVPFEVLDLPDGQAGKVAALLHGGARAGEDLQLLMDADIVLEPGGITALAAFHAARRAEFSSGLIYPAPAGSGPPTLTTHIVCNNRLYRQGVLQAVKSLYGVANFPGGLQLVSFAAYRELLVHGFLEDLTATYKVLSQGRRVEILPQVLAHEIERSTLKSTFLQRVRWTIGTIQHLRTQVRTAATRTVPIEWLLINSYHVMWELQHYVVVLGALAAPFAPGASALLFLLPWGLYSAQIVRSALLGRRHAVNSPAGIIAHGLVFPVLIPAALVGAVLMLARMRAFYFYRASLYHRS